jgi:hypothetical protein
MSMEKNLKEILDEILDEVQKELDEATTTGNVDGYQTPYAFSKGNKHKKRKKKIATQLGYSVVGNDIDNINEDKFYNTRVQYTDPKSKKKFVGDVVRKDGDEYKVNLGKDGRFEKYILAKAKDLKIVSKSKKRTYESVNESKVKRPVNRWLELKNDESMHPHKKMAMGLKELKYQLRETEKFFNWYNKIKTINELDSDKYWKRTNKHIYTIKEKLINIAKTIQEIEK